jgi:hypothetical protein
LGTPEDAAAADAGTLRQVAAAWLNVARAVMEGETGAVRMVDKMPDNLRHAGLIHLALPGARIIQVRRDPVDTCLSCFATLFTGDHPYAYDLGELGRYWRAQDGLAAHWRRVLSPLTVLDVAYEDLVADPEPVIRRMLTFCGLDWDPACLDFHRTRRPVRTASAAQVRRPLYGGSVGKRRPPPEMIAPLLAALGLEGVDQ